MVTSSKRIRFALITQGLSPVVRPLLAQDVAELSLVVESAPRGFEPTAQVRDQKGILRRLKERIRPAPSLQRTIEGREIPYLLLHKTNSAELAEMLKEERIEAVFVYSMSQLLSRKVLEVPPLGVFNLHPALLPAYRGPDPWIWMFRSGAARSGVTLHAVDPGEDTGDLIYQEEFAVNRGARMEDLTRVAISGHGVAMILKALEVMSTGRALPRIPQPKESPTRRARNVRMEEYLDLIDWENWEVERVWHFLRGTERYLEVFGTPSGLWAGMTMRVTTFEHRSEPGEEPGTVRSRGRGWEISCVGGTVRIETRFSWRRWIRNLLKPIL